MMQRTLRLAAVCALALTACDNPPTVDGGPIGVDSGPNPVDAGPIGVDTGPNPVDAGPVGVDAGPISDDAGPDSDAGPDVDAGPQVDSGIPVDAGPEVDSGPNFDAGPDVDSGPNFDAGPDVDAGPCVAETCGINECGVGIRDNGCGMPLNCGPCMTGGACADDAGCSSGDCREEALTSWTDGYCSDTCTVDADCGAGNHCGFIDGLTLEGSCLANCGTPGDCRGDGYTCRDADGDSVNECVGDGTGAGAVGDPCSSLADCGGGPDAVCILDAQGFQNGYCSRNCTSDTMCLGNSHCGFQADTGAPGACVRNCGTDAGCRSEGYRCFDGDEETTGAAPGTPDPSNECFPAGTGSTPFGGSCDAAFECMGEENALCLGGTTWFEGYCAETGCVTDADCGVGGRCIEGQVNTADGPVNVCGQACTNSTECRGTGYSCQDSDGNLSLECWTSATNTAASPGDPCIGDWECGGGDTGQCLAENLIQGVLSQGGPSAFQALPSFLGGYCIDTAAACPAGSHTVDLGIPVCLPNCTVVGDCRGSGYECTDLDGVGELECWPNSNGAGTLGNPCDTYADCSGGANGACIRIAGAPAWALGYCSFNCGGGAACPGDGVCSFAGANLCTDGCASNTDCREAQGYACVDLGAGGLECRPQ